MIFFSHSWAQKSEARRLVERLCFAGEPVWFDEQQLEAGESLPKRIDDALSNATVFLYLCSTSARGSTWVAKELELALMREARREVTIIPVMIGGEQRAELPDALRDRVYEDLDTSRGGGEAKVVQAVQRLRAARFWPPHTKIAATARLAPGSLQHSFRSLPATPLLGVSLMPVDADYGRLDAAYFRVSNVELPRFPASGRDENERAARVVASFHDQCGRIITAVGELADGLAGYGGDREHSYEGAARLEMLHCLLWRLDACTKLLAAYGQRSAGPEVVARFQEFGNLQRPFSGPTCDFVTASREVLKASVPEYAAPKYGGLQSVSSELLEWDLGRALGHTLGLMFIAGNRKSVVPPDRAGMEFGLA